jgi:hypothetical protein
MYPAARAALPRLEADVLQSYEEHHVADLLCSELWEMSPTEEAHAAKARVLIELVQRHIAAEETRRFPQIREALGRKELQRLGQFMLHHRAEAPQRPGSLSPVGKAVEALKSAWGRTPESSESVPSRDSEAVRAAP